MAAFHDSTRLPMAAFAAFCLAMTLGMATGCADSSQEPQAADSLPDATDVEDGAGTENAADETDEVAAAQETTSAATSYQDNAGLLFEDIPAERVVDVEELAAMIDGDEKFRLIDIRSWASYDDAHIAGATSIPAGQQIVLRIDEISTKITVVLVAQANERLAEVRQTLIDLGIPEENILVVDGGVDAWEAAGHPVVTALDGETYRC